MLHGPAIKIQSLFMCARRLTTPTRVRVPRISVPYLAELTSSVPSYKTQPATNDIKRHVFSREKISPSILDTLAVL